MRQQEQQKKPEYARQFCGDKSAWEAADYAYMYPVAELQSLPGKCL